MDLSKLDEIIENINFADIMRKRNKPSTGKLPLQGLDDLQNPRSNEEEEAEVEQELGPGRKFKDIEQLIMFKGVEWVVAIVNLAIDAGLDKSLTEGAPEGSGLINSKNLGKKIAQALQQKSFNVKKNQRSPAVKTGTIGGPDLKKKTAVGSSPVIQKPRHRKFFGLDNPHIPY